VPREPFAARPGFIKSSLFARGLQASTGSTACPGRWIAKAGNATADALLLCFSRFAFLGGFVTAGRARNLTFKPCGTSDPRAPKPSIANSRKHRIAYRS